MGCLATFGHFVAVEHQHRGGGRPRDTQKDRRDRVGVMYRGHSTDQQGQAVLGRQVEHEDVRDEECDCRRATETGYQADHEPGHDSEEEVQRGADSRKTAQRCQSCVQHEYTSDSESSAADSAVAVAVRRLRLLRDPDQLRWTPYLSASSFSTKSRAWSLTVNESWMTLRF